MLTVDLLKKQPHLTGLTDEQLSAIQELSTNDEEMTMKERIGEWAGRIESDFLQASGIDKKPGEKYFDYIKRGTAKLKDNLSDYQAKVNTLTKKIEEGGKGSSDEGNEKLQELQNKLNDEIQRSKKLEADLFAKSDEFSNKLSEERQTRLRLESDTLMKDGLRNVKPKAGLDDDTFNELLTVRLNKFYDAYTPEKVKATDGSEYIQYRDKDGNVYTNSNNLQKPFSPVEIAGSLISGLAEEKRVVTGSGTKPTTVAATGSGMVTGSFKSKVEAMESFRDFASTNGWAYGSSEYNDKYKEFRDINGIDKLPITGATSVPA